MMKTLKDLEKMKIESSTPFGTQYDYLLAVMEDYYIGKMDGIKRIEAELKKWDKEAQHYIANELADRISKTGIMEFDRSEILSLIK